MGFRWTALVALWTLVSGPILAVPRYPDSPSVKQVSAKKWATFKGKPYARR